MGALANTLCSRIDRVQRLKDARAEAAKEIEELKASKAEAFKGFEAEVTRNKSTCSRINHEEKHPSIRLTLLFFLCVSTMT